MNMWCSGANGSGRGRRTRHRRPKPTPDGGARAGRIRLAPGGPAQVRGQHGHRGGQHRESRRREQYPEPLQFPFGNRSMPGTIPGGRPTAFGATSTLNAPTDRRWSVMPQQQPRHGAKRVSSGDRVPGRRPTGDTGTGTGPLRNAGRPLLAASDLQTRGRIFTDLQRAGGNSAVRQRLADPQQTPTVSTACPSVGGDTDHLDPGDPRRASNAAAPAIRRVIGPAPPADRVPQRRSRPVRTEHSRSLPTASGRTGHTAEHHGSRESAAGHAEQAEAKVPRVRCTPGHTTTVGRGWVIHTERRPRGCPALHCHGP